MKMRKREFDKKYKGIKMHKFVPKLEYEIKKQIERKDDWIKTCFKIKEDYKEEINDLLKERYYLLSLIGLLVIAFAFNVTLILLRGINV